MNSRKLWIGLIIGVGIATLVGVSAYNDSSYNAPSTTQYQQNITAPVYMPTPTSTLSNNNYYRNVDGNQVHVPAYSNTMPAVASAQCRDGTYSFSQHRQGTCSHHGGVSIWY